MQVFLYSQLVRERGKEREGEREEEREGERGRERGEEESGRERERERERERGGERKRERERKRAGEKEKIAKDENFTHVMQPYYVHIPSNGCQLVQLLRYHCLVIERVLQVLPQHCLHRLQSRCYICLRDLRRHGYA